MAHPHHFRGNGTLRWDFGNDMAVSVPWYLGLAFRTRATQGVLMHVQAGPHNTLLCQVCLSFCPSLDPQVLIDNATSNITVGSGLVTQHISLPGALTILDLALDPGP